MPSQPQRDPVPPFARDVLALYAEILSGVRFPDLDHASLEGSADELRDAQRELERVESELERARGEVAARVDALMVRAHRALAYARVYADGDDELSARIHEIGQPRQASAAEAPKKRGRPRKSDAEASLFGGLGEPPSERRAEEAEVAAGNEHAA